MITSMHIENFKCFKDFDIELGPFNVLIGPNDSGKTAFLQALSLVGAIGPRVGKTVDAESLGRQTGVTLGKEAIWRNDGQRRVSIKVISAGDRSTPRLGYVLTILADGCRDFQSYIGRSVQDHLPHLEARQWAEKTVGEVAYYRLDPKALRRPSLLSATMVPTGEGLPTFLDDISRWHRPSFAELESRFRQRFSHYSKIIIDKTEVMASAEPVHPKSARIERTPKDAFLLRFETVHGEVLGADAVSDGVMMSLAFTAFGCTPDPPAVLLIEEPENGVHPASLEVIVKTLKTLSEERSVQVVLTTHSPYLLDEVEIGEVRVFTKDDEGAVHAGRLAEFGNVDGMKKQFMTGEIWSILSKAHGI